MAEIIYSLSESLLFLQVKQNGKSAQLDKCPSMQWLGKEIGHFKVSAALFCSQIAFDTVVEIGKKINKMCRGRVQQRQSFVRCSCPPRTRAENHPRPVWPAREGAATIADLRVGGGWGRDLVGKDCHRPTFLHASELRQGMFVIPAAGDQG